MQCEFSKAELTTLDLAVMDRAITAKLALKEHRGNEKVLEANVKKLDALHNKLSALIEQSGK